MGWRKLTPDADYCDIIAATSKVLDYRFPISLIILLRYNYLLILISRMSPNKIFMFLINPPCGNVKIQNTIAKHIFECFEERKGEDGKR